MLYVQKQRRVFTKNIEETRKKEDFRKDYYKLEKARKMSQTIPVSPYLNREAISSFGHDLKKHPNLQKKHRRRTVSRKNLFDFSDAGQNSSR